MYRLGQIFTATELLKNYRRVAKLVHEQPQPILITHKSGERFVFVNAEIFDDLLHCKLQRAGLPEPGCSIREQIFRRGD